MNKALGPCGAGAFSIVSATKVPRRRCQLSRACSPPAARQTAAPNWSRRLERRGVILREVAGSTSCDNAFCQRGSCDFAQDDGPSLAAASRTQVSCVISGLEYCTALRAQSSHGRACHIRGRTPTGLGTQRHRPRIKRLKVSSASKHSLRYSRLARPTGQRAVVYPVGQYPQDARQHAHLPRNHAQSHASLDRGERLAGEFVDRHQEGHGI